MKHLHSFIWLTIIAVGCQSAKTEEKADTSSEPLSVKTVEIKSLNPTKEIVLPGELKPWDKVDVFPKTKGFVKTVSVDRGTIVRKGQVLAILEAPEVVAELNQAQAQRQGALASLEEAKNKTRVSKLHYNRLLETSKTSGAVSHLELEQVEARMISDSSLLNTAKEHANSAQQFYHAKKQMVDYLTITAPFDGVVMDRNISPGTLVGPETSGQKPLFILVNSSKLRLTVAVPEIYSNSIQRTCCATFTVNSLPGQKFKANYSRSADNIDQSVRVMMTEFDVENPKYLLKAGMYADIKIPIQRISATLFVPNKAVVTSSEKVFVIKADSNKAKWVEIKKGNVVDSLTEVFGDLHAGDLIVKKASEEIRDGQRLVY